MSCHPKSVDKMADIETLTLCVSKFKSNVYLFLQGLSYRVLCVPDKNSIPNRRPF